MGIKQNIKQIYHITFKFCLPKYYHKKYTVKKTSDRSILKEYEGILYNLYKNIDEFEWIINNQAYELEIFLLLKNLIRKDFCCLDIGANMGIIAMQLARLVEDKGSVHAFEPIPYNVKRLNTNKHINGLHNLNIVECAVGDKNEEKIKMFQVNENAPSLGNSSIINNEKLSNQFSQLKEEILVDIYTLDTLVSKLKIDKIDFIKIDVEGYEYYVLNGAKEVLKKHKPIIIMEFISDRINYIGLKNGQFKIYFNDYDCYEITPFDKSNPNKNYRLPALEEFHFDRDICGNILCIPKNQGIDLK